MKNHVRTITESKHIVTITWILTFAPHRWTRKSITSSRRAATSALDFHDCTRCRHERPATEVHGTIIKLLSYVMLRIQNGFISYIIRTELRCLFLPRHKLHENAVSVKTILYVRPFVIFVDWWTVGYVSKWMNLLSLFITRHSDIILDCSHPYRAIKINRKLPGIHGIIYHSCFVQTKHIILEQYGKPVAASCHSKLRSGPWRMSLRLRITLAVNQSVYSLTNKHKIT